MHQYAPALALLARLVACVVVESQFDPDEYWQSLEVAYSVAGFQNSHSQRLTWEWGPGARLRSWLYPLPFVGLYNLLQRCGLDSSLALRLGPRLLQCLLTCSGDHALQQFASDLFGPDVGSWTLLALVLNWFSFFCQTRTYSNCAEVSLTLLALLHWHRSLPSMVQPQSPSSLRHHWVAAALFASTAAVLRPTSSVVWVCAGPFYFVRSEWNGFRLAFLVRLLAVGLSVVMGAVLLDSLMYGEWVFTPWQFVKFNIFNNVGVLYGVHPWYWYAVEGLPSILAVHLPFAVAGTVLTFTADPKHQKHDIGPSFLLTLFCWTLLCYSASPHKELRFVLLLLPLACIPCGVALDSLRDKQATDDRKGITEATHSNAQTETLRHRRHEGRPKTPTPTSISQAPATPTRAFNSWSHRQRAAVALLLIANVPLATYFSRVHQSGPINALRSLAEMAQQHTGGVWYDVLMPCHSLPRYSHFHLPPRLYPQFSADQPELRMLDCSPMWVDARQPQGSAQPVGISDLRIDLEAADQEWRLTRFPTESFAFEHRPRAFTRTRYTNVTVLPQAILLFRTHLSSITEALADVNIAVSLDASPVEESSPPARATYVMAREVFHSHLSDHQHIVILERRVT